MTARPGFVVTGGAGALGRAVVAALLARGARVAVPYRSSPEWDSLRASSRPAEALWGAVADVADADAAEGFLRAAVEWLGRLDGVATLAGGYAGSGPLERAPVDEWRRMMSSNLATTWATCRASLPYLLRGGGSVVTVASRLAQEGGAGAAAYAVSKAAVVALTRVLSLENRERGVRFNCVLPAIIDTADNRRGMPDADFTRWTPPAAVARVIVFLLSPESSPTTGALLPMEGGGHPSQTGA